MHRESDHELHFLDTLHKVGQELLADLDQKLLLDRIVERIQEATRADVVILYPYHQATNGFDLPPRFAGAVRDPRTPQPETCSAQSIPALAVLRQEPLFLSKSHELAARLASQDSGREYPFRHREEIASVAAMPLQASGESVGVLFVNYRQPQAFTSAQKYLIGVLATYASLAIKNMRTSVRHQREHDILQGIDRKLNEATNLEEVLQTILENANDLVRAKEAAILLVQDGEREMRIVSPIGPNAGKVRQKTIPLVGGGKEGTGIVRRVFEIQKSARTGNVHKDPKWNHLFIGWRGNTLSELDVPLIDKVGKKKKVIGIINLESPDEDAFSAKDQHFVETLAGQVVIAVKKAQAFEENHREAKRRKTLWDLNRALIGELDHDLLLDRIVEEAIQHTGADAGGLALYERDQLIVDRLRWLHKSLESGQHLTKGLALRLARNYRKQPYINCNDTDPEWAEHRLSLTEGTRSELDVALYDQDRLWGVLNVESKRYKHFGDNEVQLIRSLADLAVIALKNAERYQTAKQARERMKAVQELSQTIIRQSDDPEDVMEAITQRALDLTHADLADLDLMIGHQLEPKHRFVRTSDGVEPESPRRTEDGIVQRVAATRKTYRTGDAQNDRYYKGDPDISSELAVPMIDEDNELVGVLNVESRTPWAFNTAEDQELLELFATVAVIAIEDAQHHERLHSLLDLGHGLGEFKDGSDLAQAYELVTRKAAKTLRCLAVVRIYDPYKKELVKVADKAGGETESFEDPFSRIPEGDGWNGKVFKSRKTEVWVKGEPGAILSDDTIRSMVITPIKLSNELYFGNFGLSAHRENYFDKHDIALIEGLATQLAITYHRLQSVQRQKEFSKRNKKAEVLSAFGVASYDFAHRLGNELGLVRSYANLIREALGVENPEVEKYLKNIVDDVQSVLDITDHLKPTMGKFEGGQPMAIPVQDLLRGVREGLRRHSERLVYVDAEDVEGDVERGTDRKIKDTAPVYAVKSQVINILRNLVANAFEAMPEGEVVTWSAYNAKSSHLVRIRVTDTGIGIPAEDRDKIFNFLWSSKGSSGFGLWRARNLARLNDGKLTVASEPGKGSTFTLSLPRADRRVEAQSDRRVEAQYDER